jgi:hypothetical protein
MRTNLLIAAAGGALLVATPAFAQIQGQQDNILSQVLGAVFGSNEQASEQTLETDWNRGERPFERRRAALDARIDTAVRDGSLSRGDADGMRREYDDLVRLEAQYSANGTVSQQQRNELRTRYRALRQRVDGQGTSPRYGNEGYQGQGDWQALSTRSGEFEQRVRAGLQNRNLTQSEATRLRSDWRNLQQLETRYQRGGIDSQEQADLWTRYNAIDSRLGADVSGGFGNDRNPARWSQLEARLATVERSGRLSRNDAAHVRAQLSDLARLDTAYSAGGYGADQRAYLTRRYADLDQMLQASR